MTKSSISLPILVWAETTLGFKSFVKSSGFLPDEVKHISSMEKLHGYKDKVILFYDYPPDEAIEYARQHNIRAVRI